MEASIDHRVIESLQWLLNHLEVQFSDKEEVSRKYDSAGPFLSLYSELAGDADKKIAERWQQDATDGILVFSGLFSAAVTVLLSISIQDLRPNPQDTSAFYLANIYQIFADPNFTLPRTSVPSTIAIPTPFSPPTFAIWVNTLWFLSLVISLSCALLAMSLRQWARQYIWLTRREECTPNERARTRAFFSHDTGNIWAVEALPAMLHLSFFLFFSGLLVFLINVNHSTFMCVASCIGLFSLVYGWITFLPIFQPNRPYYGPLSPVAWLLYATLRSALFLLYNAVRLTLYQPRASLRSAYVQLLAALQSARDQLQSALRSARVQLQAALPSPLIRIVSSIAYGSPKYSRNPPRSLAWRWRYGYRMSTGLWKVADEAVARDIANMDVGILQWTMKHTLGEDNKLERFFEAIPGLLQSNQSAVSRAKLIDLYDFWKELDDFLYRTLSSDSIDESVKTSRFHTYLSLIDKRSDYHILRALKELLNGAFGHFPQKIKRTNILARWCTDKKDEEIALAARCVIAKLLRSSLTHDRLWIACAMDQLDMPGDLLDEITNRDEHSISLAILIQITRRIWDGEIWNLEYLTSICDFHPQKASSKLQNEFCGLWNRIVEKARDEGPDTDPVDVLRAIRHVYIALHQGTDPPQPTFDESTEEFDDILFNPSSYPVCGINHLNPTAAVPSTQLNPTTDHMHLPLQIALVTDPSIREPIQMIALNLLRLVSIKVPDSVQQQPGVTSQASEELTRVPPTVSESQSSPVMPPVLHNGVILIVPTSPVESSPVRPDHVSPTFGPPPSLPATTGLPSPSTDREHNFE